MNYKLLIVSILSFFSLGRVHAFVLINTSVHSLCVQLDWYSLNPDTQIMELARVDKAVVLDAKNVQTIELNEQYEQVWVTVLYEDGTKEEAFKLVVEPYELDKSIDTTCRLLIADVNDDEIKFKLQGKKFVEMANKAALLELLKRQKALALEENDQQVKDKAISE